MGKRGNKLIFSLFLSLAVLAFVPQGKIDVKAADIPPEVSGKVNEQGLKDVYDTLFNPSLEKENVKVVTPEEAKNYPVAMTKLKNGKVAYTVNGEAFYPLGIETGWWDTRVDDNGKMSSPPSDVGDNFKEVRDEEWNAYFSDMKNMGFNTVQLMIYWEDWEPVQGKYDFTFLDHVTGLAAENGLKTELIIFFHSQTDNIPRIKDKFWGYNIDNTEVGGEKYSLSMQWGDNLTSAEDIRKYRDDHPNSAGIENFLEYWHPEVFKGITNALTALGRHYKDSANIVGYQIGNEEGFNYYVDNGNDKNPYYKELYNNWKKESQNLGKDENKFRAETINNLWKCFNNALHAGDPYKPTTTNTQSGNMEKNNIKDNVHSPDGTTMDFYKSVDMIGSMFYGEASSLYPNLDSTYQNTGGTAYATGFPILFPTEISGTMNNGNVAKVITGQTIARGGQGIGIYCYGELYNNFEQNLWSSPKPVLGTVKSMLATLHETQDVIWSGIPVTEAATGNMFMALKEVQGIGSASQGNPKVSVLQAEDGRALGVLNFPGNANNHGSDAMEERTVVLNFTAKETGTYKIKLHKTDGTIEVRNIKADSADTAVPFEQKTTGSDVTYIVAEKTEEEAPADKQMVGVEILNLPDKVSYILEEEFSTQGLKIRVRYNDGSAEVLAVDDKIEISRPDMSTVGQKEVAVTYKGYKTTFHITVQEARYQTNFEDAADTQDSLKNIFDNNASTFGGFVANDADLEKMKNQESYFQYNFTKKMLLKGVKLATNYAEDQAVLSFKLAVPAEDGTWAFLGGEGGEQFDLNWQTNAKALETQEVPVAPIATDKVRMYVLNAANKWTDNYGHGNHKFEMAEIQFQTEALPEVTGIYIKNQPEKQEYALGEKLDTTGISVIAVYSDASEQEVTDWISFSGYNEGQEGIQQVTVNYQDKWTADFSVTVCRPEKLSVIPPNKTVYSIGEELDTTGMQVFAELPSGRKIQIPLSDAVIGGADFSNEGEKVITVTYQGAAAEFKVMVQKNPGGDNPGGGNPGGDNPGGGNPGGDNPGGDNPGGSNPGGGNPGGGNPGGSNPGDNTNSNKEPSVPNKKPVQIQKKNAVKTGDATNVFAWAGLAVISVGVILAAGLRRRLK